MDVGVPASAAVLAIDAGNSKTDAAVLAADGRVAGTGRGGGFQPARVGIAAAVDVLAGAVAEAFADAGTDSGGQAVHVSACLANADLPVEEEQLGAALAGRGWGLSTTVRNDTFAVLRAGLPAGTGRCGVAVVCGAGVNCVGMLPDGRTARFPALGRLSGDWGGGGGLGEAALWHAARAEDGRGGPTALAKTVPAHFGLGSVYELIEAVHLGRIPYARRLELTPVLFAAAAGGDHIARSLVTRMADEVVAMSAVALERLGLLGTEVPVLLGGGILAARHPLLEDRIRQLLAERAPKAVPRTVSVPPVLGAALLGLDHLSAPDAAYTRVREFYGEPR